MELPLFCCPKLGTNESPGSPDQVREKYFLIYFPKKGRKVELTPFVPYFIDEIDSIFFKKKLERVQKDGTLDLKRWN